MNIRFCLFALWMILLSVTPTLADPPGNFEAQRAKAVTLNPPGVSLELRLPEGRTQFHQGEIIPLTAVFASTRAGAYKLNTDPGSRDLQWGGDSFHVEPSAGVTDPLALNYEGKSFFSYNGRGPQFQNLELQPIAIPYTLNEWLRFDAPGHYRVYLTSGRVVSRTGKEQDTLFFQGRTTTSGAVDLEILPDDPAWSARMLQQALPLYNSNAASSLMDDARLAATRTVRFLGTPEAARAMIARYGRLTEFDSWNSQTFFQTRLGLFGSPQRALILREMAQKISEPDYPIFPFFLDDLAQIQLSETRPDPLPPYPGTDPAGAKTWQARSQAQSAALTAFTRRNLNTLAATVADKRGRARAVSLYTLFSHEADQPVTADRRSLINQLVAQFDQLTPEEQSDLLNNQWAAFRIPAMLPVLRRLYANPSTTEGYTAGDMRSLILRRLTDLAPAEGRAQLLQEISSGQPHVDMETLHSLPDKTLPALDKTFAAHLTTPGDDDGLEVQSGIVERYATGAILPRVKAVYSDKVVGQDCAAQAYLLAYLLRTDRAYGVAQMRKALAARQDTGCFHTVLSDVAALYICSDLQRLAVSHLQDPDGEVAADAAKTLGDYGSAAAEAPLWQRLSQWHEQWQEKAGKLEATETNGGTSQGQLEWRLCEALALSPAWLTDQTKLQRLQNLCLTQNQRSNIHTYLQAWVHPISISYGGEEDSWQVVQYDQLLSLSALEAKLAQFPRGTKFVLSSVNFLNTPQQQTAYARLRPFLLTHGLTITKEPFAKRPAWLAGLL